MFAEVMEELSSCMNELSQKLVGYKAIQADLLESKGSMCSYDNGYSPAFYICHWWKDGNCQAIFCEKCGEYSQKHRSYDTRNSHHFCNCKRVRLPIL
jgi:hypothetical protein